MGDVRTWDFGMGDMRDAFTMMNADELKKKMPQRVNVKRMMQ